MGPEILETIDAPYRIILDAAERDSSRNTYIAAAKNAREVLVAARSSVLAAAPVQRTGDSSPNFAALAADTAMQAILERRWQECTRCIDAGAPLAATVMMGGLLEALLVSRANKLSDKSKLFKSSSTPIDPKTKKPLELRQWMLGPYNEPPPGSGWLAPVGPAVS